jgi:hypothetical protein
VRNEDELFAIYDLLLHIARGSASPLLSASITPPSFITTGTLMATSPITAPADRCSTAHFHFLIAFVLLRSTKYDLRILDDTAAHA